MKLKYFVILTAFSGLLSSEEKPNEYYAGPVYAFNHKYKGDCAHVIANYYKGNTGKISKNAYQIQPATDDLKHSERNWQRAYTIQQWNRCLGTRNNFKSLFNDTNYLQGTTYKRCGKTDDCKKYFDRDVQAVLAKQNNKAHLAKLVWENIAFF
jgi:hypothetical protein